MKQIQSGAVLCPLLAQNWAARLVNVLNGAQVMLVARLDGTIIAASGQTRALLGRAPAALVGRPRGPLFPPDAAALARLRLGQTVTDRVAPSEASGLVAWAQVTRTPLRDSRGEVALLMEQVSQITPDEEPTLELTPVPHGRVARPASRRRLSTGLSGVCF